MHSGTLPSSSASTAPTLPSLTHQGSVPPASSYLWTAWSAILPIATSATIRWFLSTSLVSPATNCSTTAPPATALNAVHASTLHTSWWGPLVSPARPTGAGAQLAVKLSVFPAFRRTFLAMLLLSVACVRISGPTAVTVIDIPASTAPAPISSMAPPPASSARMPSTTAVLAPFMVAQVAHPLMCWTLQTSALSAKIVG